MSNNIQNESEDVNEDNKNLQLFFTRIYLQIR
jgi:hypothetical protein